jgi:uracil-DNA glycosylase
MLQTFKKQKECGARKDRFISAKLVFIREAPGNNEDEKRKPFVEAADRVLSIAVEKAGKKDPAEKDSAFKCRPPGNRVSEE